MNDNDNLTLREIQLISAIKGKYSNHENEFADNMEGLLYHKGVNYHEYINTDILLKLQQTKTNIGDEEIFIIYHQITELYFKLTINELKLITDLNRGDFLDKSILLKRIGRILNNFRILSDSFDVLSPRVKVFEGLTGSQLSEMEISCFDTDNFRKFRLALLPASGFQSFQLRLIEIMTTSLHNLLHPSRKADFMFEKNLDLIYPFVYWKYGGLYDTDGGKQKTRSLSAFEKQYDSFFQETIQKYSCSNLYYILTDLVLDDSANQEKLDEVRNDDGIREAVRILNNYMTFTWKEKHLDMVRLHMEPTHDRPQELKGTGGSNWSEYLPPANQALNFFPGF